MAKSRARALILGIGFPLLMLIVGWQLGAAYEKMMSDGGVGGSGNVSATQTGAVITDPEHQADISLLWDVWRLLQRDYVDPSALVPQTMVYGAVRGLVAGIGDPYTVFMPPTENADFRQTLQGKLQGIGAELTMKDGFVTVVSPLKGSPAEHAGIRAGDIITEVDGKKIDGLALDQVVSRIRGKKGTTVVLKIARQGEAQPLELSIQRDEVTVPSVESRVISATGAMIGYVALNQFGENSMAEIRTALASFKDKPIKGIALDLRNNGGGYLDGAIELVSMFQKSGNVVSVVSRGGVTERHDVSGNPVYPDLPLVVIVNGGSASASEITAGALQDTGRATIIGVKSFGKGTVQDVIDLKGGSSLRVTIAKWLTPKGRSIAKEGITPDVKVQPAAGDVMGGEKGSDVQLDAALRVLLGIKPYVTQASASTASSMSSLSGSTLP